MANANMNDLFVRMTSTVQEVIACIDRSGRISIALVVDEQQRLINTITDGDVRRGILAGLKLDAPASALLQIKARMPHPLAVTAPVHTPHEELRRLMQASAVRQIPLVDAQDRVVDIVLLRDLLAIDARPPLQAVIMAGGFGKRLRPLTENLPKPMVPIGDKPLMELNVEKLRNAGIHRIHVTTHHLPEKIVDHFGDGKAFGVEMDYVNEDSPLGTAGALGLMPRPDGPMLVMNGDILSEINIDSLHSFHHDADADMTVAVRTYSFQVPYGVVECEDSRIVGLKEKPNLTFFVNAGIYVLNPEVYDFIPKGKRFDMTDLIEALIQAGRSVASFPVTEYWLDIGQHADYLKAQQDALERSTAK